MALSLSVESAVDAPGTLPVRGVHGSDISDVLAQRTGHTFDDCQECGSLVVLCEGVIDRRFVTCSGFVSAVMAARGRNAQALSV